MTASNSPPTSLVSNHPPLAHDAQGCKIAVPSGTTHWRILRCTPGRPKLVVGADGQPSRFPLELTHDELLDACGSGKYRLEALDEYGNPLACVTSVTVGLPDAPVGGELVANNNQRSYPSNDIRIALETIAQLSRAHSESLQSLANAQADWIKTLATSKQIPRNAAMAFAPAPTVTSSDGDTGESPSWFKLLQPAMPAIATAVIRNLGSWLGGAESRAEPAPPRPKYRNASALAAIAEREREKQQPTGFDARLAAVCEQLDPDEREAARNAMRMLQPFYGSILERMSLPQAVEFTRGLIKNDKPSRETSS